VLDAYAACETGSDGVKAIEKEFLEMANRERSDRELEKKREIEEAVVVNGIVMEMEMAEIEDEDNDECYEREAELKMDKFGNYIE